MNHLQASQGSEVPDLSLDVGVCPFCPGSWLSPSHSRLLCSRVVALSWPIEFSLSLHSTAWMMFVTLTALGLAFLGEKRAGENVSDP